VLALLAPALFFLLVAAHTYREEFAAARATLDGATRVAQEHALKLFDTNEMLLQRMLDMLGDTSDEQLLARGEELHKSLRRMTASLPQVQGVYVTGADGRMVASDRVYPPPRHIDYSDREYFIAHRTGDHGAFVSAQLVSRSTGEAFFDISRRRSRVDGSFAGMVNVSLRPQYLTDFYKEIEAREPGLRFAVLRADGSLVARWPGEMKPGAVIPVDSGLMRSIASGAPQGHADGLSAFDPVERLRFWRATGYLSALCRGGNWRSRRDCCMVEAHGAACPVLVSARPWARVDGLVRVAPHPG
jgi:two-component system NtrC family sensor kinase